MKTISITLDDDILQAVDVMTKMLDMTVSAFVQDALRHNFRDR
jgi:predicted transcriptional regulator